MDQEHEAFRDTTIRLRRDAEQYRQRLAAIIHATRGLSAFEAMALLDEARRSLLSPISVDIEASIAAATSMCLLDV